MTTLKLLFDIAMTRMEKGALAAAESLFSKIRDKAPEDVDTLYQLARIALLQNRYDAAEILLAKVIETRPDRPEILTTLGRVYLGTGRARNALTCLERAGRLAPKNAETHRLTAEAFFALKQYDRAVESVSKAVSLQPVDAEAHAILGDAMLESRHPDRALECYDRSIAIDPDNWKAWANRGMALIVMNRLNDAKDALVFAEALNPMEPVVVFSLVSLLIDLGDHVDAAALLEKLDAMMPNHAKVHLLGGVNAYTMGDSKTAVTEFVKALTLDENNPDIKRRLAEALLQEGKVESAAELLGQLTEDQPSSEVFIRKAETALLLGDLAAAGKTVNALHVAEKIELSIPRWKDEDLTGKTILLYARFGLDEFNVLIRMAHQLKARGAKVCVECTEPVRPLVDTMASVDETVLPGEPYPPLDYCISLEALFCSQGSLDHPVEPSLYLSPDKALVDGWVRRFSAIGKPKVGLMWRKETHLQGSVYHTVPLSALSPLFEQTDVHFVSMQTGTGLTELESFAHRDDLHMVGLENEKMDQRLACIAAMDLLITPDTLTAEIAAAAGLPVWVLLGTVPKWYWKLTGAQTLMFPTARLFRQSVRNQWHDVVRAVTEALRSKFSVA